MSGNQWGRLWCIIDLSRLEPAICGYLRPSGYLQPKGKGPTVFYDDRAEAEAELLRLSTRHARGQFVLFEAVAQVNESPVVAGVSYIEEVEA